MSKEPKQKDTPWPDGIFTKENFLSLWAFADACAGLDMEVDGIPAIRVCNRVALCYSDNIDFLHEESKAARAALKKARGEE